MQNQTQDQRRTNLPPVQLTREQFAACFDREEQGEVLLSLYRLVFPDYDSIFRIEGYPTVNKDTSQWLWDKWIEFDAKYHPNVMSGGLWLNLGFKTEKQGSDKINDFQVSLESVVVIYK